MKRKLFNESITLNSGHAIILSHKPDKLSMEQINKKLVHETQDIEQFGLFDSSSPNYTTYYPEVTAEDLKPQDSEFIEPVFRMLSNVTVHANWNPIYFPAEVLKKSMSKLVGQTVNIDHEMALGNAIGAVKAVEWQNEYTVQGIKIPAGINAVLRIDGKSNPRIARGIMMDPPSIHANSVTVNFTWEKSHPELTDEEFSNQLGKKDSKGKLIQKIAVDILMYYETSLVGHGADPFAQKVGKDGKIVLPKYAKDRYPLSDIVDFNWDWKSLSPSANEEVILNSLNSTEFLNLINDNNNSENMEKLLRFLETFFGMEVNSLSEENVQEKLGDINFVALKAAADKANEPIKVLNLEGIPAIENELNTLRTFKASVPENLESITSLSDVGKTAISELKAETKRLYGLTVEAGKEDVTILALIEGADYKTLQSLHNQYDKLVDDTFKFTCTSCGSHDVTRASADSNSTSATDIKSSGEVLNKFTGTSGKFPAFMQAGEEK